MASNPDRSLNMYNSRDIRNRVAIAVPVHFPAGENPDTIRQILENTFANQDLACPRGNLLAVVDRDTPAECVFREAGPGSPLQGIRLHSLARNRCKAGAVREGLELLLETTEADFFVTRDCDGDHTVEDIPRLVHFLIYAGKLTGNPRICVMGSRSSLAKPMGWVRQEWERLTNDSLLALLNLYLGGKGMVLDQRFWNGSDPDIQSGFRVYSRQAADCAVKSLSALPEDRAVLNFACEFEPFLDISLESGVFCQVNRLTLVEQPVSSYRDVDYANDYGSYLKHAATRLGVDSRTLLRVFDNAVSRSDLAFTDFRKDLLKCRSVLGGGSESLLWAPFA